MLREGIFTYFTTENGLSNNQARNIYEDESELSGLNVVEVEYLRWSKDEGVH